jgi:hypothetical protein
MPPPDDSPRTLPLAGGYGKCIVAKGTGVKGIKEEMYALTPSTGRKGPG